MFQELWEKRDDTLPNLTIPQIDKLFKPISRGISITVFAPGIESAYVNGTKQEYRKNINLGLNTLMKHLGVCCSECYEVVPSYMETWSKDNKTLEKCAVNPNFKDGRKFSAIHPDHQEVPACGYVQPSLTVWKKKNVAEGNLMVCSQKCNE